jgi:hypothetical protein
MFLKDHEKFVAFVLLGAALVGIAFMVYLKPAASPPASNDASLSILNTIVGALTLAFGGVSNALFKITAGEKAAIGQATADALRGGNGSDPQQVEVTNTDANPVPVEPEGDNNV